MIIYGTRAKQLLQESILDKCEHCQNSNTMTMYVFQKYAHVFWIPFFPIGKTGISQCEHCKQALKLKEMPATLRDTYNNLKQQTRTPIWMFSGSALLAVLFTILILDIQDDDRKTKQYVAAPAVNDILNIKTKDNEYSILKVVELRSDSVFVLPSAYMATKSTRLYELREKEFSDDTIILSKTGLQKMLDEGTILRAFRDK